MAESSSEERMRIPERASFDKLNRILLAYLKAGADKKTVSYRDASVRSGISHTVVSPNNRFFVYAGFLEEAQRGRFKLTERGAKYAQLMDWGRLEEAKDQMREILKESPMVGIIIDYVTLREEVRKDDLSTHIGSVADVSRIRRFTIGINALIDMLVFSGLLQEKDGMFRRGAEIEATPPTVGVRREKKRPITTTPSPYGTFSEIAIDMPKEISIPISLTLNITDITDIHKLRAILRAIKEELLEDKGTKETEKTE